MAGVPLTLPAGERASDWETAAGMAGFTLSPQPAAAGVVVVAGASGWEIQVREPGGVVRKVPVVRPRDAREREDLVWIAASLAAPLLAGAPQVPRSTPSPPAEAAQIPSTQNTLAQSNPVPPTPATTPTPKAAPKAAPKSTPKSTPKAAPKATPKATPPPIPAPAPEPQPTPEPVATPPSPPEANPEPPPPATATPAAPPPDATLNPPAARALHTPLHTPLLSLNSGLAVSPTTAGSGELGALTFRGAGRAAAVLGAHVELGLNLALQTSAVAEVLSVGDRWGRASAGADLGLRLGEEGWLAPRLTLSAARYRFRTDSEGRLGALTLPSLALNLETRRALALDWLLVGGLGVEQDLRTVLISSVHSDEVYQLSKTHIHVSVGIAWGP